MNNFEEECIDCLKEKQYIELERELEEQKLLKEINQL